MALPPNQAAVRLLDGFLADSGARSLEELLRWLLEASPALTGPEVPRTRRLAILTEALAAHPRGDRLRTKLREVWVHESAVRLLAETGLPTHGTLFKESLERMVDRLVPRHESSEDLYVMLSRLSLTEADADWVESLPAEALAPWSALLALPPGIIGDAARLVAYRAAALGITRELLTLDVERADGTSPFLRLPPAVDALLAAPGDAAAARLRDTRADCDSALARVHRGLEERGVSTDILFRLELLEALFVRLDDLVRTLAGDSAGRHLAGELLRGSFRQRGVRSLARNTMKRLALKVTEHTAETGEHYVARDLAEWDATGRSAAGGGVITAFTALLKYIIAAAPLAPLVQGLGAALNYSGSFIAMQFAHFTLASKQPAMTGAALANALGTREDAERQVELVAGITRSQVVATLGNVFATIPVAVLVVVAYRWLGDGTPLDAEQAVHSVHSVHPFRSLTIPFAMLTGVFLWMASLAAGWAANWSAYRGLAEALRTHRGLRVALGASGAERAGRLVEQHLSGIVGYLALGMLLGFVPVMLDRFVGLPIEVRHVTLQAASLALAAGSLFGTEAFHWGDVVWGALGVVLIAGCNLGVSFALALRTAARARDLGPRDRQRLASELRAAFAAEPRRFLWRPRA